MKKGIPILLALLVFAAAYTTLKARQEKEIAVVAAAADLPAGYTLTEDDLTLVSVSEGAVPEGAVDDPAFLVDETLRVERLAGDWITPDHLGGQRIELRPDERGVAVEVTDSAGLAGLLRPGDRVGVTAVLSLSGDGYAKMIAEDLRVLYISPEFRSVDPAVYAAASTDDESAFAEENTANRERRGVVVLAVPTSAVVVAYDFAPFGVESTSRTISVIDLLPALDQLNNVKLSLFIQPDEAQPFTTSGVFLTDLVVTPSPEEEEAEAEGVAAGP